MSDTDIPCVELPKVETLTIPLPYGAELKSIVDLSKPPTDCAVVQSLLLQLNPLLAGLGCLFKILDVLKVAKDILESISLPPDPLAVPGIIEQVVTELTPKLAELARCFLLLDPCQVAKMISAILDLIIRVFSCLHSMIKSILEAGAGIDLSGAAGNPTLLASLNCAESNLKTSMMTMKEILVVIQPILDMLDPFFGLIGVEKPELPPLEFSTGSISDLLESNPLEPIETTITTLRGVKDTVDAIC